MSDTMLFWFLVWFVVFGLGYIGFSLRRAFQGEITSFAMPVDEMGYGLVVVIILFIVACLSTAITLFLANTFGWEFVYQVAESVTETVRK